MVYNNILVTGANGLLGSNIVTYLKEENVHVTPYSHNKPLDGVDWGNITHIINCAAVTPNNVHSPEAYYLGNIRSLENLLPFIEGKKLIHFSTVSIFYKSTAYQFSKLIGEAILFHNKDHFSTLDIVLLPTLDDKIIIEKIVNKVIEKKQFVVDKLIYNYCDPREAAKSVINYVLYNKELIIPLTKKDLYEEVVKKVNVNVSPGKIINRACFNDGLWSTNLEAKENFIHLFTINE